MSLTPNTSRYFNTASVLAITLSVVGLGMSQAVFAAPQQQKVKELIVQDGTVEFEALSLSHDDKTGDVIAKGNVKLVRKGFTLEAGQIRYNMKSGKAVATGAVKMTDPDGNIIWSETIELNNALKDAFVSNIRLIMKDGAQLAAQSAERSSDKGTITLNRAVYSPCEVCVESKRDPMWQLKAVKVVHDKGKKRLYYSDAYLEIFGLPILWLPQFSHPDPTVDRASGLLPVEISSNRQLGFILGLPYYHPFSESSDITIKPIITSKEGIVLAAEYRQHVGFGQYKVAGSITYVDERDQMNDETGRKILRGHIFADGKFNHGEHWLSSVDVEWASDDTYLRRYDFSRADTLTSQYKLEGFYGQSYFAARTIAFQGLRREDSAGITGQALPLLEADYVWNKTPIGGRLTISGNALAIYRSEGMDSQRLSLSATWDRRDQFSSGLVMETEALLRADFHALSDVLTFAASEDSYTRTTARFTSKLSFPLIRYAASSTQVIEPILSVSLSPKNQRELFWVNEDTRSFELNEYNIFDSDRFEGSDVWETGIRATYGLKFQHQSKDWSLETVIGQSYSFTDQQYSLFDGTGLRDGDFSDFVTQINLKIGDNFHLSNHLRLDEGSLAIRRHDMEVSFQNSYSGFDIRYLNLNRSPYLPYQQDREEIRAAGRYQVKENWWISGYVTEDLTNGRKGVDYGAGIDYRDDCMIIGLQYRRNFTFDRDIAPGRSLMLTIKLRNLG